MANQASVTTPPCGSKDPAAIRLGQVAGRSHALKALDRRVAAMVDQATELTPDQLTRLRRILTGAVAAVEPIAAGE